MPHWVLLPGDVMVNTAQIEEVDLTPGDQEIASAVTIIYPSGRLVFFFGDEACAVWAWWLDHVDAAIDVGEIIDAGAPVVATA
jgi:hypothetical protein